jgi:trehalose/maltose hydrolase-like predicted phosphorylase
MRSFRTRTAALVTAAVVVGVIFEGTASAAGDTGAYQLTATSTGGTYAPTFTGNGVLGVRVPPAGQGYAAGTVPAQSELAGFYVLPASAPKPSDRVQQRANIPTWSTLTFSDGGQPFSLSSGHTSGWRQTIDLHTGVVSTTARWTAPNGHVTDLSYSVLTDRARPQVGLVRLILTPHWSGPASVTDEIDGTPATLSSQGTKGWDTSRRQDWVSVRGVGTNLQAAVASQIGVGANVAATVAPVDQSKDQSVGQRLDFPVLSGQSYQLVKYVGVASSATADPTAAAQAQSSGAAAAGLTNLLTENASAWAALWRGRIDVVGNRAVATMVNASQFYLWSSTRAGVNWSVSPAGLSSNGYDGHIFWDAETWMYPALLAQHPDLAAGMNAYRYDRLQAAEQHAAQTGYQGARYPWESALDGTEQIPPPVSVNSEGLYEQHITADIALAQWQYYLATGDRGWLRGRGWPVLSQAAAFWASRATRDAGGHYHITHVTGPDEENPNVNDEVYTNVGAINTLTDAVLAAQALGIHPPASWSKIASHIVVGLDRRRDIHPEFAGYRNQLVKQADVTLLQYPWAYPMAALVAQSDINFYVPRNDPTGPSMSDAVNSIDTSALGSPGCASYAYTQRSYEPFIKDPFDQFSETRTGGAFTFMTGIGGFLQEFLYGYPGLRWSQSALAIDPSLTAQLGGLVIHDLRWHQRTLTIALGARTTTVSLSSGAPMRVHTPLGVLRLTRGHRLRLATRRPDLIGGSDALMCGHPFATTAQPGAPALAAVDGSPATDWQPAALPATLTVTIPGRRRLVSAATLRWGQQWPPAPAPNVPPPPGPVKTVRASSYTLLASTDGHSWRTLAKVRGRNRGTVDALRFPAVRARFVRVVVTRSNGKDLPMLEELSATP